MKISEEVRKEIVRNMTDFCRTVRKVDPEEALSFIVADQYLSILLEGISQNGAQQ